MNENFYILITFLIYVIIVTLITNSVFNNQESAQKSTVEKPVENTAIFLGKFRKFTRSIIFLAIASILLLRANYILELFDIKDVAWYTSLIIAVGFGLLYSFFPVTSSKSLAFVIILVHIRFIYLLIAAVLIIILVSIDMLIASIIILIPVSIFSGIGYLIIKFGLHISGLTGASIATIIFIAIILSTARRGYDLTKLALTKIVKPIWEIGYDGIIGTWKRVCVSLYDSLRQYTIIFGYKMGGNITLFSEKKTT
jgi:hypothetical protein